MRARTPCTILLLLALIGCAPPTPAPTPSAVPTRLPAGATPSAEAPTETVTARPPTVTPSYPEEGYGPANFPPGVNPLTGLAVADARLLERRPLAIKVENLPRADRPQFGLTQADLVYEYYTEQGTTRFTAVYYGADSDRVGPIRSARFFDVNVIRMYKAVFAFGSAYQGVLDRLYNSDFAGRLVVEGANNCPPMCRYEPSGRNYLVADTAQLSDYIRGKGVDDRRQNLDGMSFQLRAPEGGQAMQQAYVRYSAAIYNRWDYEPSSGRYSRWVDQQDDPNRNDEIYGQLTDRGNKQPVTAANVAILYVPIEYVVRTPQIEVLDYVFTGSGPAYLLRDGQIYALKWQRMNAEDVVTLVDAQGKPFPFKPGNTWFEVIGASSRLDQSQAAWRFTFAIP